MALIERMAGCKRRSKLNEKRFLVFILSERLWWEYGNAAAERQEALFLIKTHAGSMDMQTSVNKKESILVLIFSVCER